MKIEIIKKTTINGKNFAKGAVLSVVNERAAELIAEGKAVEFGTEVPKEKPAKSNPKYKL
jgi:hypothetical protein